MFKFYFNKLNNVVCVAEPFVGCGKSVNWQVGWSAFCCNHHWSSVQGVSKKVFAMVFQMLLCSQCYEKFTLKGVQTDG
jgi:hypothetical protein